MAHTAHRDPEQVRERFDDDHTIKAKADLLVEWIKNSKHFVVFTGAGISTSAGIPDFRGPQGVWTLKAQGKIRTEKTTSTEKAVPTLTHMALVQLQKTGLLKFLISQNCDGLHRRSGFPPSQLAELHGNSNLELCSLCGKEYLRDFVASATYTYSVNDHRTGRRCNECNGELVDSIINFGEDLPQMDLELGFENAEKTDLCLVLGSSLTVSPACNMPGHVGKNPNARLVICNLQNTPFDKYATEKINARTDDLMKLIMEKLNLDIPKFILRRRLCVEREETKLTFQTVDFDGTPSSVFADVIVNNTRLPIEPFVYKLISPDPLQVTFTFFGHYNEPNLNIQISIPENKNYYDLFYDPMTGSWAVEDIGSKVEFPKANRREPTRTQRIPDEVRKRKPPPQAIQSGFSVNPRRDCPHFSSQTKLGLVNEIERAYKINCCKACKDASENWLCLSCGEIYCSRYVNGHAQMHYDEKKHSVATSFSDLSFWCYSCDDYITHPNLDPFIEALANAKFGSL